MSLLDSIYNLSTDEPEGYIVTRRRKGVWGDDGKIDRSAATVETFTVHGSWTPGTGLSRVVGGQDMRQNAQGNAVNDVRQMYTETELFAEDDHAGYEPDQITFQGKQYLVFRVERWELGVVYYHVTCTALLHGGS